MGAAAARARRAAAPRADSDFLEPHPRRPVRRSRLRADAEGRGRSICRAARHRSTSPITCTPTSGTAAAARRSTAASCRSTILSPTARSSRSSPASRRTEPRLARPGAGLPRLAPQPRQGARLVPQPGRRREPERRPRDAERELARSGAAEQLAALARRVQAPDAEHLYQLLGSGDLTLTQPLQAAAPAARPGRHDAVRPAGAASAGAARRRDRGRRRPADHAGTLLRSGAARADHRLRDARPRRHDPPRATAASLARMRRASRSACCRWSGASPDQDGACRCEIVVERHRPARPAARHHRRARRGAPEHRAADARAPTRPTGAPPFALTRRCATLDAAGARAAAACAAVPNVMRGRAGALGSASPQRFEDVDRALVGGERRLVQRLRQRRVRMDRALQVLAAAREYSIASTASAISSPAIGPMMCTPRISSLAASATSLTKPAPGFHRARAAAGGERETRPIL